MAAKHFYGWRVVAAALVLAVFGWGFGFYGPPFFLHAVRESRGWPVALVSAAVTLHFLFGAFVVANLPAIHRRHGIARVTQAAAVSLALGTLGWASAVAPWQIFGAALLSGAGWAAMSSAALNAIVAPWFVRQRPMALSMAYNGASVGGIVMSPLWAFAIASIGFPAAALAIGAVMLATVWLLATRIFAHTPQSMGLAPDGDPPGVTASSAGAEARALPGALLWRDRRFRTLAAGMALGLFAQLGLVTHLYALLVPALGARGAGLAMGLATIAAILARSFVGWVMTPATDRRLVACVCYAVQIAGLAALLAAGNRDVSLMLAGIVLFGSGIGNATSLPPLIAQSEFARDEVARVVSLIVAIAQSAYAFAPAAFGLILAAAPYAGGTPLYFGAAALIQGLAIVALLAGRRR
ncbi:MAG: MFS transporter [Alphaproteobacteria bacterium]|nr:MFS transporter [Alphaproteobacteria bacterium]